MKKFVTFTAIFCLLFCVITGCVTTKKTEEESGSTTKISTTKESISSTESTSELLTGLEVSVYKIIDNSNVIIQFNKDFWGYTDVPNYEIKDKSGKVQEIISITSAFAELGGQIPRVFHIVFKSPLSPGEYTITVSNITDSLTPPLHKFAPASTTLIIPEELSQENNESTGKETTETDLEVSVYKIIDKSNIIIKFNKDLIGYTDIPNYVVKDGSGKLYEISSITSAFTELGSEVPNVFHIVFKSPLSPGEYTVTISNITDNSKEPAKVYKPITTNFTIK